MEEFLPAGRQGTSDLFDMNEQIFAGGQWKSWTSDLHIISVAL